MTSKYSDEQRVKIAKQEYKKYEVGKQVKIDNNKTRIGYVSQVNDDPKTGGQSYVITDKKASKAQSNPNSVKEVTVLYQGSGNPMNEGLTNKCKPTSQLKYLSNMLNQTLEKSKDLTFIVLKKTTRYIQSINMCRNSRIIE